MEHRLELPDTAATREGPDALTFVGNATVLMRCGGFTILTDPNFVHRHEKVGLGHGLHATRLTDPAMEIEDLPPIDLVLLSHYHGDHFDQVAQERLDRGIPIVTTPQAAGQLTELGFTAALGLDTWDAVTVTAGSRSLRITSCPGQHGPGVADLVLPDVMGSMVEWGEAARSRTLYITGDTLMVDDLTEIPRRYPAIDIGIFHLGGTKVLGILVSMDAEQGLEAMRLVDPGTVVPVHHADYDVFTSALEDFLEAADAASLRAKVRPLAPGETWELPPPGTPAGLS
jgi:L-ascorbate metabolism protein UlaG (beta-lactamase superfamily)